jgi:hypothetical protein
MAHVRGMPTGDFNRGEPATGKSATEEAVTRLESLDDGGRIPTLEG